MSEFLLFHTPGACSRVALNALEETGVVFADRAIDLFRQEQRSPEMLAVNPKGKVPALQVGDRLLTENAAILLYLDARFPEARLLPGGGDALDRAIAASDLVWLSNTVHPTVRMGMMPARFAPGDPGGVRSLAYAALSAIMAEIERRLGANPWWYGADWAITDVYVYWCASTAAIGGFDLSAYAAIQAHAERVRARPGFQRALARERRAVETGRITLPPGARL